MEQGASEDEKAQSVMESFLQTYGDEIDAVFSHDDEMAQGAITAIEANNLKAGEDIKIAGIDGQKSAIQATYIQLEDYVIDSSNAEAELENGF